MASKNSHVLSIDFEQYSLNIIQAETTVVCS